MNEQVHCQSRVAISHSKMRPREFSTGFPLFSFSHSPIILSYINKSIEQGKKVIIKLKTDWLMDYKFN